MSVPQRVFLSWSRPAVLAIAERLLAWNEREPDAFRRSLVLAPTRESCRRLREELGRLAGAALTPRILPVGQLLAPPEGKVTPPVIELAAWVETLTVLKDKLPSLLPRAKHWKREQFLDVAVNVQEMMRDLSVGGLLPDDVNRLLAGRDERSWRELSICLEAWSALLHEQGLTGSIEWTRIEEKTTSRLAAVRGKVILACVPGVSVPVRRALEASCVPVEVWVHAPEETAHLFDAWGQPTEAWREEPIHLSEGNILPAETAADLAELACETIASPPPGTEVADTALGVCDPALTAPLACALEKRGSGLYEPEGESLAASGWMPLLRDVAAWAEAPGFAAPLLKMARSTIVACGLGWRDHEGFCRELSALEQTFFPETAATVRALLAETATRHAAARTGSPQAEPNARELGLQSICLASWDALSAWVHRAVKSGDALLTGLALWGRRCAGATLPAETDAWRAAAQQALADVQALRSYPGLSVPVVTGLLAHRFAQAKRPLVRRREEYFDASGWVEMLYARESNVVLAGFSDGMVPESPRETPLLTEKLRGELGLEHVGSKAARDSYLLRDLVESRKKKGSVRLLFARFSSSGDPLAPSPLLFRCRDEALPERVLRLFGQPGFSLPRPPRQLGLWKVERRLTSWASSTPETKVEACLSGFENPWAEGNKGFSPSRLNLFWACPMRFWIAEAWRLGGNEPVIGKATLDAREVGNVLHEALRLFAARFSSQTSLEGMEEADFLDAMDQFLQTALGGAADRRFMPAAMQRRNMRRRLHAYVPLHVRELRRGWECVLFEHAVGRAGEAWEWQGHAMEFRLDRLDVLRDGTGAVRRVRVVDYKTGNPADYMQGAQPSPAKKCLVKVKPGGEFERWFPDLSLVPVGVGARRSWRRWADLQMPVYAAWAAEWAMRHYGLDAKDVSPWYCFLPADPWATCMVEWENFHTREETNDAPGLSLAESGKLWAMAAMECIGRGSGFVSAERLGWDAPPYDRLKEVFGYAPDFSRSASEGRISP